MTVKETLIQAKQRTGAERLRSLGITPVFTKAGRLTAKSSQELIKRKLFWHPDKRDWVPQKRGFYPGHKRAKKVPGTHRVPTNITLDPDVREQVDAIASSNGTTISATIERLIVVGMKSVAHHVMGNQE